MWGPEPGKTLLNALVRQGHPFCSVGWEPTDCRFVSRVAGWLHSLCAPVGSLFGWAEGWIQQRLQISFPAWAERGNWQLRPAGLSVVSTQANPRPSFPH